MCEEWKIIKDNPKYQVSNLGRVKSLAFGRTFSRKEGIMKPQIVSGTLRVVLLGNSYSLAKLVYETFNDIVLDNKQALDYKDGNFKNCALSNLYVRKRLIPKRCSELGLGITKSRKKGGMYRATICIKNKTLELGEYETVEDAKKARETARNFLKDIDINSITSEIRTKVRNICQQSQFE